MEPVSLCDRQPHKETTRCCHPPRKIREGIIPQLPASRPRRASSNETSLPKMHADMQSINAISVRHLSLVCNLMLLALGIFYVVHTYLRDFVLTFTL